MEHPEGGVSLRPMPLLRTTLLVAAVAAASLASAQSYVGKISVNVVREGARLPIHQVPRLRKGDVLQIRAPFDNRRASWSMIFLFTEPASQVTDAEIEEIDLQKKVGGKFNWEETHEFTVPSDTATPLVLFFPKGDGNPSGNIRAYLKKSVNDLKALTQAVEVEATRKNNLETFLKAVDSTPPDASPDDEQKLAEFAGDLRLSVSQEDLKTESGRVRAGLSVFRQAHENGKMPAPEDLGRALAGALPKVQSEYLKIFGDVVSIFASFTKRSTPVKTSFLPTVPTPVEDQISLAATEPINYSREKRSVMVYSPAPTQAEPTPLTIKPTAPTLYVSQGPVDVLVDAPAFLYTQPYGSSWSLKVRSGTSGLQVPLTMLPGRGFSFDASLLAPAFKEGEMLEVAITGRWGFDNACEEQPFRIVRSSPLVWSLAQTEAWKMVARTTPEIELSAADLNDIRHGSVQSVSFEDAAGKVTPGQLLPSANPGAVRVRFDLANAALGSGNLLIARTGLGQPDALRGVVLYPPVPDGLVATGFVGDPTLVLSGAGAGQVVALRIGTADFSPANAEPTPLFSGANALPEVSAGAWAMATLKDGRVEVPVQLRLLPKRPVIEGSIRVSTLARPEGPTFALLPGAVSSRDTAEVTIVSKDGRPFPVGTKIEFRPKAPVAAPATLTLDEQSPDLVFAPGRTSMKAVVKLGLIAKSMGGPFEYRVIGEFGGASEWQAAPVSIVRLPSLLTPRLEGNDFRLTGTGLIFVEKIFRDGGNGPAEEIAFTKSSVPVTNGASVEELVFAPPVGNAIYVKLLDFETPLRLTWTDPAGVLVRGAVRLFG